MTHEEILARFDEKFPHMDFRKKGDNHQKAAHTHHLRRNIKNFLLEALKQERLRTLEDAERAVEDTKKGWDKETVTQGLGNDYWCGMSQFKRDALENIRNLKPKD